jgi:hypothetical protein
VIGNGLREFSETLPKWFDDLCGDITCRHDEDGLSREVSFKVMGGAQVQGKLSLEITEAQFTSPDERREMFNLAMLAILRSTKCEDVSYKPCPASTPPGKFGEVPDCDRRTLTVCTAASDIAVQMRMRASLGKDAAHAWLHFALKWEEPNTSFDCSILELPGKVIENLPGVGNVPHIDKVEAVLGPLTFLCKAIVKATSSEKGVLRT